MNMISDIALDKFLKGKLKVSQPKDGYRFSLDSILLANYVKPSKNDLYLCDLGSGCGIMPLILSFRFSNLKIYGIEIQDDLYDIAVSNVKNNKMEDKIEIINKDLKLIKSTDFSQSIDIVISNPPYRKINSGRINPNKQKAASRHEIYANLQDVINTAHKILKPFGRFILIYPASRLTDAIFYMRKLSIEPIKMQMVQSYADSDAKLVIIEGIKGGKNEVKIVPLLVIYNQDKTYTEKVNQMFL